MSTVCAHLKMGSYQQTMGFPSVLQAQYPKGFCGTLQFPVIMNFYRKNDDLCDSISTGNNNSAKCYRVTLQFPVIMSFLW